MIGALIGAGAVGYCAGKYLKIKVVKRKWQLPIIIKVKKKRK